MIQIVLFLMKLMMGLYLMILKWIIMPKFHGCLWSLWLNSKQIVFMFVISWKMVLRCGFLIIVMYNITIMYIIYDKINILPCLIINYTTRCWYLLWL